MKRLSSVTIALAVSIATLGVNATLAANASSGNPSKPKAVKGAAPAQPSSQPAAAPPPSTVDTAHETTHVAQQDSAAPPAAPANEPFDVAKIAVVCDSCHGPDGNSQIAETPSLAAQTARYLYLQLKDFKEKRRENALMSPMAANLDKPRMLALAQYYAEKKLKANDFKVDAEKIKHGKAKADEVLCTMCHLGGFLGQNDIPRVAGQRYDYIVKQLKDFRAMKRTNDAGNMTSVSKTLKDEDIEALAQYLTNLN